MAELAQLKLENAQLKLEIERLKKENEALKIRVAAGSSTQADVDGDEKPVSFKSHIHMILHKIRESDVLSSKTERVRFGPIRAMLDKIERVVNEDGCTRFTSFHFQLGQFLVLLDEQKSFWRDLDDHVPLLDGLAEKVKAIMGSSWYAYPPTDNGSTNLDTDSMAVIGSGDHTAPAIAIKQEKFDEQTEQPAAMQIIPAIAIKQELDERSEGPAAIKIKPVTFKDGR